MIKKRLFRWGVLLIAVILIFCTAGCASTKNRAKNAPDNVGSAAVDEATDAVSDIARDEVRKGVNSIFKKK